MTGRRISLPNYKLKDGKLIPNVKAYSVSKQLQIVKSKKVRVAKRGQTK